MCTWESSIGTQTSLRQYQIKPKWLEAVLKVARCTPEVQRQLEQLHERWKKNWDALPLNQRFSRRLMSGRKKMSRIRMCGWRKGPNELLMTFISSRNDVTHLQSSLKGIGSSRQAEALDGVQIAAMSDQRAKLTAALAESERKRVAEQESMSETIQQIKEQVMNLARRPTTSAPDDTDDESDKDDYVDLTP
ncbi:hypothetical protein MTR67_048891 [Solanum verrucosum]|uniref:Uncharacterized protein n=1 Tax=Solanum verrucosum TaxID=315347 RepID=A0AAF0V289_SOLVR|nr:hypothetical protein MTR67_048891 [Solanum verrucosum]